MGSMKFLQWVRRDCDGQGRKEGTLAGNESIVDGHGSFNEEGRGGQEKTGTVHPHEEKLGPELATRKSLWWAGTSLLAIGFPGTYGYVIMCLPGTKAICVHGDLSPHCC